ncbi:LysR family transcriptional regulator [Anaeroselena agilis]|uniref:LysR family transcriptional regulator n=1 Tax=Anaeroselena agilis TaxID=3063788 RepID=A0ABU3NXL6_9FIRM|nr:LysR family transcriptional regulator [Selenomonadales bacterium 4137-cl]
MDLKKLRYFLVLAEELHFARAAERLFIAQPPLSRQIRRLEEELGAELFARTKRTVKLTPAGEFLRRETALLFEQIAALEERVKLVGQGTLGQVRIGYVGAVMHSLLPSLLTELGREYPQISTMLEEMPNQAQVEALRAGRIDLGLVRSPVADERLVSFPVLSETFSLVISADHPLAAKSELALRDLADEPFICFSRECAPAMVDTIFAICRAAGFAPRKAHETSQINTILRLVESKLGYSVVPSGVREGYRLNLRYVELDGIPERAEVALLYNPALASAATGNIVELFGRLAKRGR